MMIDWMDLVVLREVCSVFFLIVLFGWCCGLKSEEPSLDGSCLGGGLLLLSVPLVAAAVTAGAAGLWLAAACLAA